MSDVELSRVRGMLALANTKLDRLLKCACGVAVNPTVDFIVDRFDRDDSNTLGTYWSEPGNFGIRNRMAGGIKTDLGVLGHVLGGSVSTVGLAASVSSNGSISVMRGSQFIYPAVWGAPQSGTLSNTSKYSAVLSSHNFTVALTFDISEGVSTIPVDTHAVSATPSTYFAVANIVRGSATPASMAGVYLGDSSSTGIAVQFMGGVCKAINVSISEQAYSGPDSYVDGGSIGMDKGSFGSMQIGNLGGYSEKIHGTIPNTATDFPNVSGGINTSATRTGTATVLGFVAATGAYPPQSAYNVTRAYTGNSYGVPSYIKMSGITVGSNKIVCEVSDSVVVVKLNGTTIHTTNSAYLKNPSVVGMSALAYSVLAAVDNCLVHAPAGTALSMPGTTLFKAWVSTVAEPPDEESGHGTYAPSGLTAAEKTAQGYDSSNRKWSDKYHVYDRDTGATTYNPNA
jgi:hypothetical protein